MTAAENIPPSLLPKKLKTKSVRIFHPGETLDFYLIYYCVHVFLSTPASNRRRLINGKKQNKTFMAALAVKKQNKLLWPHLQSKTKQTLIPVRISLL